MKFYLIMLLVCILFFSSCQAQSANKTNQDKMEKFDIARFNEKKVNREYSFTLPDHSVVRQVEHNGDYTEEINYPLSPYTKIKSFFKETGSIKITGERFYSFPVGTWHYF